MADKSLDLFRKYIMTIPPGKVDDTGRLDNLLADCWDQLDHQGIGGMYPGKLLDRMENIEWNPPTLKFDIERHGAAKFGSTRAEIQRWAIDIDSGSAGFVSAGYRQIIPRQSKVDVKPLAEEIAQLIRENRDNPSLSWSSDRSQVRVNTGKVRELETNSAVKRTLEGRRKRFRNTLQQILESMGWEYVGSTGGSRFRKK